MYKKICSLILCASLLLSAFLTSCSTEYDPTKGYKPLVAENEDSTLKIWFEHSFTKVSPDDTKSSKRDSYYIRLAKNEIEGCQFILYSETDKKGYTAEITTFKNSAGDEIEAEIFKEHYLSVGTKMTPDALPPLMGEFDLEGGKTQAFYIKIKSTPETTAGEYEAVLSIKKDGKEVKKAKVFAKVWDFTLSDDTACTTALYIGDWALYVAHEQYEEDDRQLYKIYYDYLLENRISAYYLPYDLLDPRADEYLNNPRVTSFCITGYKTNYDANKITAIYNKLSQNPDWLDKGYFYYVDEPTNPALLYEIESRGFFLESVFPGYQMVSPFFTDIEMDYKTDQIEFMSDYIKIWCNKPYAYKTKAEIKKEPKYFVQTEEQNKKYGTYAKRMEEFKDRGDKVWWYVCWEPQDPYANILMEQEGVVHRVLFWQQKQYKVDGFLYYAVNNWTADPWNDAATLKELTPIVYGDGVLVYDGHEIGLRAPVGSLRLEAVRDGIEDFEYLTMAEKALGTKKTDKIIKKVSRSILDFTRSEETFVETRIKLGNALEKALKNK